MHIQIKLLRIAAQVVLDLICARATKPVSAE